MIVVALLPLPAYISVSIYMDSQNIIDTFYQLFNLKILQYPHECFKIMYIDLWYILFQLINTNHISVIFHKVKVHANNFYNNYVD